MRGLKRYIGFLTILFIIAGCRSEKWDESVDNVPPIFPDYDGVTVPVNIAPLNFKLIDKPARFRAVISSGTREIKVSGKNKVQIRVREWRRLLRERDCDTITVSIIARKDGKWLKYLPFRIFIKGDPIDPFLVYRLIAPGYEAWSSMSISQRDLTSFRSEPVIDNRLLPGACMNCHSFRANDPGSLMFHLRGNFAGTVIVRDGKAVKLNTKTNETISNCVYPYWHPSGDYIAYSVNNISQVFHSVKEKRIEVFDSKSDIVVYDLRNNKLLTSSRIMSESSFETFPAFSPDGKTLFFCSGEAGPQPGNYDRIKYSLCSIAFGSQSGTFGEKVDTLISSHRSGKSISFPRVSPDGKYLVFTLSDYGNFSIWHREADLYLLNLASGVFGPVDIINSGETESYHSWSSNSRWMVFSSRRIDGLYTRPFIAYFNGDGSFSKPFLVPQKDPDFYSESLFSFNVPELVKAKVESDGRSLLKTIGSPAKDVNFELRN